MNNRSGYDLPTEIINKQQEQSAISIPYSPHGRKNLKWLSSSFLWMLSAAGSGELLFTPRIAALYGYSLL